jgi:hypothetical protein
LELTKFLFSLKLRQYRPTMLRCAQEGPPTHACDSGLSSD